MYVPLFNKSNYSLLSSLLKIDDIINYSITNNIEYAALIDDNMYGVMEFIKKCEQNRLKPIIGLHIKIDNEEIVLIAINYRGYQNLMKISSLVNIKTLVKEDFSLYNNDLIAIVLYPYTNLFKELKDVFENIFLGYKNKLEESEALMYTKEVIFFQENLYIYEKDSEKLGYLYKIRDNKTVSDECNYETNNHNLLIENIYNLSSNEGINNTLKVASLINFKLEKSKNLLPVFDCEDSDKYLFELCKVGLLKRLNNNINKIYQERLTYEINIITKMGFSNYFLIVYDFIKYAKKNQILVGPGRGSAAGSLVAYCLGITDIDPIKYNLLFERFLNPERISMPDIDTDFAYDRRDEVIEYVVNKYGKDKVAGIVTFGTLSAKAVIRDVSRVLNIPIYKVDKLNKYIPSITQDKLDDIYNKNSNFKASVDSDITLTKMFKLAKVFEGFPRHISSHAAGIVMSKNSLEETVPLTSGTEMYLTSYSMEYLEDLGLLKIDFLGLKNLTLIDNIIKDINKNSNQNISFNDIEFDDKKTYKLFSEGDTTGIFQFESSGMRKFLKQQKVENLEDLFTAIAIYRPGAAENINVYLERKHKNNEITYIDDSLKDILKSTYGVFIYQEQIMQTARIFANYSLAEADLLRRAISKKKYQVLKDEEEKFIKKAIEANHDYETSKKIFEYILKFAGYGFNRSHSVAYSFIAYKMAYLKAHYKEYFYTNLLTNVIGSELKTSEYIVELKSKNIKIEKPSFKISHLNYITLDKTIICPISIIKGIGGVNAKAIININTEKVTDIYEAFSELVINKVSKKSMELLVYANFFREFNINMATLIYNFEHLYNYAELAKDIDLSLISKPELIFKEEYKNSYLLQKELEVFGFYLANHPTNLFRENNKNAILIKDIDKYFNKKIEVIVIIEKIKVIDTKNNKKMAFLKGSDESNSCDFTLFPNTYEQYKELYVGRIIKVMGVVEKRLDQLQIIVQGIEELEVDNEEV